MLKSILLSAFLGLLSGYAFADPIYLNCSIVYGGKADPFSITIDEDAQKVVHSGIGASHKFSVSALFSPNEIIYDHTIPNRIDGKPMIKERYTLNRFDLSITLYWIGVGEKEAIIDQGSCKIVDMKDRKI